MQACNFYRRTWRMATSNCNKTPRWQQAQERSQGARRSAPRVTGGWLSGRRRPYRQRPWLHERGSNGHGVVAAPRRQSAVARGTAPRSQAQRERWRIVACMREGQWQAVRSQPGSGQQQVGRRKPRRGRCVDAWCGCMQTSSYYFALCLAGCQVSNLGVSAAHRHTRYLGWLRWVGK